MATIPVQEKPYLRPQEPEGINPWFIRIPVLFLAGGVLLVLILVSLVGLFHLSYRDKVTPGVTALGVDLSGMTRDEAVQALSARFTYDESTVFTFRAPNGQTWQFTAGDLGVSMDVEAMVDEAMAISAGAGVATGLIDQGTTWLNGADVAPIIRYDQNASVQRLMEIAAQINQEPKDATLTLSGLNVVTTEGSVGRVVDIIATLNQLQTSIVSLSAGAEIPVIIHEAYPTVWNVDEAAGKIRAALSSPLELVADGANGEVLGPWTASTDQIAALLALTLVEQPDGTRAYDVSIDMSIFAGFLDQLAPGLIASPRDGRFHFDEVAQQLVIVQPAVNGRTLNVPETLSRLEQAVFRYDSRRVPMAFDYTLPRYHDHVTAAELGITSLVAESTTFYTGSTAERRHNIAKGASLFDGVIIGPGEEFSFNTILGDLSIESGFMEAKVIVGERTVDGVGGGICQVSTTAFRAAFTGGFPIIERNSHAYRVGYYEINAPPGWDAAIWTPERDFRFQNDTPYHLLIETSVYPANNSLQFRFYSTNPGRVVEIQQPVVKNIEPALPTAYEANSELAPGQIVQVDWSAEGADVTVPRIIRDTQGNVLKEDYIYTHYLPWRAIYQVAPGDSRLNSGTG